MKKSLVALAALAAVSAASAQSSVTLYGIVDIGYAAQKTDIKGGGAIRTTGLQDSSNAGNRIGFRGTEDLGGGLKANFVVEQGISPISGGLFAQRNASAGQQGAFPAGTATPGSMQANASAYSAQTNRQSYVGLSNSEIGTFNIGYQYTNNYELGTLSGYHIGSEGIAGGYVHTFGNAIIGGTRANGVTYISPNFSGFTVRAQVGAPAGASSTAPGLMSNTTTNAAGATTADASGRRYSLMGQYANGPLSAALAYTSLRSRSVGGTAVNTDARTANMTQLGASYDFGVAKLGGTYSNGKDGGTAAGTPIVPGNLTIAAVPAVAATTSSRYRAYQVGVSVPFGAIVPYLTYGRGYVQPSGAARIVDIKQAQLGVRYSLSKRTTGYAMYGRTNDKAAAVGFAETDKKTVVGVMHSF
jgi:predicted porin